MGRVKMGQQVRLAAWTTAAVALGVVALMAAAWALPGAGAVGWSLVGAAVAAMVGCNVATVWWLARPWAELPGTLARLAPLPEEVPELTPDAGGWGRWMGARDPVEAFASRASRTTARLAALAPRLETLVEDLQRRGDAWARCRAAVGSPARQLLALADDAKEQLGPCIAAVSPPAAEPRVAARGRHALADLEQALASARACVPQQRPGRATAAALMATRQAAAEVGQAVGTAAMMLGHASEVLRALNEAAAQAHHTAGRPVAPVREAAAALAPAHEALSQALAQAASHADRLARGAAITAGAAEGGDTGPLDEALGRAQQAGYALATELRERATASPPAVMDRALITAATTEAWAQEIVATLSQVAAAHGETDTHLAGVWQLVTELGALAGEVNGILGILQPQPSAAHLPPTLIAAASRASSGPVA